MEQPKIGKPYYLLNTGYGKALTSKDGKATHFDPTLGEQNKTKMWELHVPDEEDSQAAAGATTWYTIVSSDNPTTCLELVQGGTADQTPIVVVKSQPDRDFQQWKFVPQAKKGRVGYYMIYNRSAKNSAIRIIGSAQDGPGNLAVGYKADETDSFQGWLLVPVLDK